MLIDTHCHLSREYYDDISKVILENKKSGIRKMIVSSCEVSEYDEVISYSKEYDIVYLSLGIHPEFASTTTDDDLELLKNLLTNTKKVVAVGEIGLDYHYTKENKEEQKELFRKQMAIAYSLGLPVVIHSRDAVSDTIDILREFPNVKGVIHCFSSSLEVAKIYKSMGYKLGIGGVVTFKNSNLSKTLEKLSIDDVVLETDSPYLTPEPYRGKQNSSKYLIYVLKKISLIYGITEKEAMDVINNTTKKVFNL